MVNISQKLNQQHLQEILMDILMKGNESEDIKVDDIVEEIKQKVLAIVD